MRTPSGPVLLVSDVAKEFEDLDISRLDLEVSERETIRGIMSGIGDAGYTCKHIQDPKELPSAAEGCPNSVVLSIWSGTDNRNRRAIVPSICEAHQINYIGADPYAAMISGDKELSKTVCADFGISAPRGLLIHGEDQLDRAALLDFPIVVKPLMEGGSIGITQQSKANDFDQACDQLRRLMKHHKPPILCEEFVGGREVSFCLIGSSSVRHIEAVEVRFDGEDDYFEEHLFSMQDKRSRERQRKQRFVNVTSEIPASLIAQVRSLFLALGKVDYMRIDGKLTDRFWCLELSTDPSISKVSLFAHSYYSIGKSYREMISDILSTRPSNAGGGT
ncbi:MAG: hypothetical protein AAFQ64_20035 [Pseudomonadota bacterium]